ncbi:MAG: efflux transporter outer membrane subunit [Pseudogulbenkiania sp.]|nr:efflux transporter outer membrane subunit [Pseudogulbenkiania sp.]
MLLLSGLLAGCATPAPSGPPATPLTAQQLALPAATPSTVSDNWWTALGDPALDRLIEQARQHSPSLKLAAARVREAAAQSGLADSRRGPQLDANAALDRERYSANGLTPAPIAGSYRTFYSASLDGSWELDLWGKHRAEAEAALGQQRALELDRRQAELLLAQAVASQYTALQRTLAQQQVTTARQNLADSRLQLLRARVSAGLLSGDALRPAEVLQAQLKQQSSALRGGEARARHALAALTGQAPAALDTLAVAPLGATPALDEAALNAGLLGLRPDVAAQREQLEATAQTVKAARAAFYPNVQLNAFIGLSSLDIGQLLTSQSRMLGIAPAVTLPIFHSGALRAKLSREQARYDQAVESYNQTVLEALRQAADALANRDQARQQLADALQAEDSARHASDAGAARLHAGLTDKLGLLGTQDTELAQRASRLDSQAAGQLAFVYLNTALGGGQLVPAQH